MIRYVILCFFCCLQAICFAQNQNPFMKDANGMPLYWGSTYRAEGSPYFHNEYNWAEITTANGTVYTDVRVKFNLVERKVQYMADDGTEMLATTEIRSIRFPVLIGEDGSKNSVTLISKTGIINNEDAMIYQVLDSGKISLLRKVDITFRDEKKYSEAVITRHFERKETEFLLLPNGEYKKLEKSRSFISGVMVDKLKEIDSFISSNNLKCKSTKDFQQIVNYYNSLN